ncbi:MAG: RsmB/NOP family class I SAM-dependent RNA methyltransferase [Holosporaceae bacterium]|jgi:16S rRNA (cytosine967-C5)-methyltransferase|nr:RsmB/NOP family class I SAM-dependent RNA methyltransferase [Holosporaceae bacterium]
MQYAAKISATIDLLDIFLASSVPFDIIMAKFFKNNRWVGASDRREIAELSYAIFRNYELMKFYTSAITSNFGRFFVITFLRTKRKLSLQQMMEIFSGKPYAPSKLTDFELHFMDSLNAVMNDNTLELPLHVRQNYPLWMESHLQRIYPAESIIAELSALNQKANVDLRTNTLKTTRIELKQMLQESGVEVEETRYAANGLRILNGRVSRSHAVLAQGFAEIQDEGSQLVAEMCQAKSTDTVIDFCAGAGGKTLALAAAMQNKGRIFALDKYPERLEHAKVRLRRANVGNVFCHELTSKWIKRHCECADVVLVDAPCSGSGTWRRNPDMRAKFSCTDLGELLVVQSNILQSAAKLVRRGGRLLYATCSILMEENEDQINDFLKKFPEFESINPEISQKLAATQPSRNHLLRLSPAIHGTDGFFVACLGKK